MRRASLILLIAAPLAAAASAPLQAPAAEPLDVELKRARSEARAADAQVEKLQQAADKALNAAARLRAQQLAAAQAVNAAEARISAADTEVRLVAARQALLSAQLQREQQPVSSLLAGLAMMARRPPLLALADNGSTDELVRVRVLLDSTLPVIRARTAGLSHQLAEGARLQETALAARNRLQLSRAELGKRRQEFAALELHALKSAAASSGQALSAGDAALAATETVDSLTSSAEQSQGSARLVAALAQSPVPPSRPIVAESGPMPPSLPYILPANAPVAVGLGAVSASGVRSRGIVLRTGLGAPLRVPASGVVRFAGPFRDYDGVVIIDHGRGWMSLIVNIATQARSGEQVRIGEPLGRALAPVEVELSHRGRHVSPAIIAGSSASLSNGGR